MSVRAYKVKKIELEKDETFNLWHDNEVMGYISDYLYSQMNEDGCGIVWLDNNDAKQALKRAKKENAAKDTLETLDQIVKDTANDDGGCYYSCY